MPFPAASTICEANRSMTAPTHNAAIPSSKGAGLAGEAARGFPSPGSATDAQWPVGRKRRRIPRACDDCRRKKIKCDGKRPCASCADFNSSKFQDRPTDRPTAPVRPPSASSPSSFLRRLCPCYPAIYLSLTRMGFASLDLDT